MSVSSSIGVPGQPEPYRRGATGNRRPEQYVDVISGLSSSWEGHVPVGGATLFVRRFGVGRRNLVMVHGGPDWDHSYLLPPVPLLARHATVTLFDLRGCGRSQWLADP